MSLRGKWGWIVLAAVVAALDLWSKSHVFATLGEHETVWVFGNWLGLTRVENRGMMWGKFPEYSEYLRLLRVVAAVVVIWMLVTTPARSRMLLLALALVLGGAVGNIYDGFVIQAVRDFLMVKLDGVPGFDPFPVFNVADSAICVGVALLALGLLLDGKHKEAPKGAAGDAVAD